MVDRYLRQSPLAHLGLEGRARGAIGEAGVAMAERPFPAIVDLRGQRERLSALVEQAVGLGLPEQANTAAAKEPLTALWLGPDQWWLVDDGAELTAAALSQALAGQRHAATDIGESRARLRVAGPRARDLLAKGCPLDLHPRVFPQGNCAQSLVAKAGVLIHRVDGEAGYDLYVLRSFADYLWRWLTDAAGEYGLAVLAR